MRTQSTNRRHHGFFAIEMTVGLVLLLGTATLLAIAASKHAAATHRLEDSRAAMRRAEEVMTALQLGEDLPKPQSSEDASVTVERLPDTSSVPGTAWARVCASVRGRSAELVGLVVAAEKP